MTTIRNPMEPKGVRRMPPSKKHRPALWENILGTLYAYNGEAVQYFDFDWLGAQDYAGVNDDCDPRLYKAKRRARWPGNCTPPSNQLVLWILKDKATPIDVTPVLHRSRTG